MGRVVLLIWADLRTPHLVRARLLSVCDNDQRCAFNFTDNDLNDCPQTSVLSRQSSVILQGALFHKGAAILFYAVSRGPVPDS